MTCMRQGMLTSSGAPSTTCLIGYYICPFLDYYILSIFHKLGSPLSYHTLIFDLMSSRNMYLYMHTFIHIFYFNHLANQLCFVDSLSPRLFITK